MKNLSNEKRKQLVLVVLLTLVHLLVHERRHVGPALPRSCHEQRREERG